MFLIEKGRKPKAICRECRALHTAKECPRSRGVDWVAVRRAGDEFYKRALAYQELVRRNA